MAERKFILLFTPDRVSTPVTFRLAREYNIDFNILRAEVNEQGGKLILSMSGDRDEIRKALAYLEKEGVHAGELDRYVVLDSSMCTDCSLCVSICPAMAYRLDRQTWKVHLDRRKCIACGMCLDVCPARAISKNAAVLDSP